MNSQRPRQHAQVLHRSALGPLNIYIQGLHLVFYGTSKCANDWLSDSCVFSWALFFLLVCLVPLQCDSFFFVIFYFIIFYYYPLETCYYFLPIKRREGVVLDGREVEKSWRIRGRLNHYQDILCEEKNLFYINGKGKEKSCVQSNRKNLYTLTT